MAYHDEYLKNIEEYDEIHDTNYLETLHQYLLCNGSIQHVASNMFCHRNTITYRMRVIEDHWNLKLDDTVEMFHLMVAFLFVTILDVSKFCDLNSRLSCMRKNIRKKIFNI